VSLKAARNAVSFGKLMAARYLPLLMEAQKALRLVFGSSSRKSAISFIASSNRSTQETGLAARHV
jgi:hypothetical protein